MQGLKQLWQKNRGEILKVSKRKNVYGNTETQVSVLKAEIRYRVHATPAETIYADENKILFSFKVFHEPFLSYKQIDELFYQCLKDYYNNLKCPICGAFLSKTTPGLHGTVAPGLCDIAYYCKVGERLGTH